MIRLLNTGHLLGYLPTILRGVCVLNNTFDHYITLNTWKLYIKNLLLIPLQICAQYLRSVYLTNSSCFSYHHRCSKYRQDWTRSTNTWYRYDYNMVSWYRGSVSLGSEGGRQHGHDQSGRQHGHDQSALP